jgi:hypothetical protein
MSSSLEVFLTFLDCLILLLTQAETTQGTAPSKRPTTQPSHTHTTSATLNFIAQSANNHGAKQSSGKKACGHHGRS